MRLTEMKPDKKGLIQKIGGDAHFLNRITAIGVTEGTEFQTVRNDRKMPVLVYLRETLIAINREEAERIEMDGQDCSILCLRRADPRLHRLSYCGSVPVKPQGQNGLDVFEAEQRSIRKE